MIAKYRLIDVLFQVVQKHENKNLIIMGDFNTPFQSVWFEPYKKHFTHCFQEAGSGLMESWPAILPLLSLDHIWIGKTMKTISCSLTCHSMSDHKMLIADLCVRE